MEQLINSVAAILFTVGILYLADHLATKKNTSLVDLLKVRYIIAFLVGMGVGYSIAISAYSQSPIVMAGGFIVTLMIGMAIALFVMDFLNKLDGKIKDNTNIKIAIKRKEKNKRRKKGEKLKRDTE